MGTLIKYRIVMELIRTVVPCIMVILQVIIIFKLF